MGMCVRGLTGKLDMLLCVCVVMSHEPTTTDFSTFHNTDITAIDRRVAWMVPACLLLGLGVVEAASKSLLLPGGSGCQGAFWSATTSYGVFCGSWAAQSLFIEIPAALELVLRQCHIKKQVLWKVLFVENTFPWYYFEVRLQWIAYTGSMLLGTSASFSALYMYSSVVSSGCCFIVHDDIPKLFLKTLLEFCL